MPILVEDGATRVSTRCMGRSAEVHRHHIAAVGLLYCPALILSVELLLIDLLEATRHGELPGLGVLLLHHPFEGGRYVVLDSICGAVALDLSEGEAEGAIGIGPSIL